VSRAEASRPEASRPEGSRPDNQKPRASLKSFKPEAGKSAGKGGDDAAPASEKLDDDNVLVAEDEIMDDAL
jgi:hypothetical protein